MIRVAFSGGKELAATLEKLSKRVSKRLVLEALRDAAEPMRLAMERKAPRDSGRLRESMVINNSRGKDALESAVAIGPATGAFYGSFQEFGSSEHSAQPFMRPALDEQGQKALQDLADNLWRELAGRGIHRPSVSTDTPVLDEV